MADNNTLTIQPKPVDPALVAAQAIRLEKCRTWITFNEPFWTSLMFLLTPKMSMQVPTYATNGRMLFWNPEFAATLSDQEMRGVVIHEIMHAAFRHMTRIGHRNHMLWNIAGDFEINGAILEFYRNHRANAVKLPPGGLFSDRYKGWDTEHIYSDLEKSAVKVTMDGNGNLKLDKPGDKKSPGKGKGKNGQEEEELPTEGKMFGEVLSTPGAEADQKEVDEQWKQAVLTAYKHYQNKGDLPANIQRLVDDIREPKQSWREILREFMVAKVQQDTSWNRINRRYAGTGFILPHLDNPAMGAVVIAIDTSGSIDETVLNMFLSEVQGLIRECRPCNIYLCSCDAQVHSEYSITSDEDLPREYKGGGGTSFIPVFEWIAEQQSKDWPEPPVCLVYFTDGMGTFPSLAPAYPTLWALTMKCDTPFGTNVNLWEENQDLRRR